MISTGALYDCPMVAAVASSVSLSVSLSVSVDGFDFDLFDLAADERRLSMADFLVGGVVDNDFVRSAPWLEVRVADLFAVGDDTVAADCPNGVVLRFDERVIGLVAACRWCYRCDSSR